MSRPAPDAVASELDRDAAWRHLDRRMLLVHPVNEVVRFLPLVIGVFFLGRTGDGDPWHYLGVAVPIAVGLWRFASTRFRITGSQIELRRGLLGRSVLTAPLDRVRTVELTASPIHRVLGLAKVEIGTGSAARNGDSRLVLDSLGAAEGRRLRAELLAHAPLAPTPDASETERPGPADSARADARADEVLVRLDPAWVRFAPLTTSGLVIALATVGGASQVVGDTLSRAARSSRLDETVAGLPLLVSIPAGIVVFVVVISTLAIAGYVLANWGFTLTRDRTGRAFHVRRGLLTTRETSIDVDRLRGLEVHEPLGLRLAGGGRLTAVVTGLGRRAEGSTALVPPAPRAVVVGVGEQVLNEPSLNEHSPVEAGPLTVPLVPHGAAARRRRHARALLTTSLVPLSLLALWWGADWPLWLATAGLLAPWGGTRLAADRYAGLGHALTERYLVVRAGSFQGRRDALQRSGIIGWNVRQTFFQRRAGLCTLSATTAAGKQVYHALDMPESTAIALADAAVPGLVGQFLTGG